MIHTHKCSIINNKRSSISLSFCIKVVIPKYRGCFVHWECSKLQSHLLPIGCGGNILHGGLPWHACSSSTPRLIHYWHRPSRTNGLPSVPSKNFGLAVEAVALGPTHQSCSYRLCRLVKHPKFTPNCWNICSSAIGTPLPSAAVLANTSIWDNCENHP